MSGIIARSKAPVDRRAIWEQYNGLYGICGKPVSYREMHIDHIIPLTRGGTHQPENVQPSHGACNRRKSNKLMDELEPTG